MSKCWKRSRFTIGFFLNSAFLGVMYVFDTSCLYNLPVGYFNMYLLPIIQSHLPKIVQFYATFSLSNTSSPLTCSVLSPTIQGERKKEVRAQPRFERGASCKFEMNPKQELLLIRHL